MKIALILAQVGKNHINAKQKIYIQKARGFSWPFSFAKLIADKIFILSANMA